MSDEIRCEHCGTVCQDDWDLQIFHRGCRLRAAFPDACTEDGPLLKFDMSAIAKKLEEPK